MSNRLRAPKITARMRYSMLASTIATALLALGAGSANAQTVIDTFSGPSVDIAACGNDSFVFQQDASFLGGAREAQARDGHSCVFGGRSRVTIIPATKTAAFYGRSACEQSLMYGTEIGTIDHSWSRSPNKNKGSPLNLSLTLASKIMISVNGLPPSSSGFFGFRLRDGNGATYTSSISFNATGTYELALSSFPGLTAAAAADIDGISIGSGSCHSNSISDSLRINGFAVGSADADGDGVPDNQDAFPNDPTESADSDGDGRGNNSDAFPNDPTEWADSDGDGRGNNSDAFPADPTEWADSDGDGRGNNSDAFPADPTEWTDSDGDGRGNNSDVFPNDPTEWADTDGDGFGNNGDAFPLDASEWADADSDGYGDNGDEFPADPTEWADNDADGIGNNADANDNSDLSATVVVAGINSGVVNHLFSDGNSLADLVTAGSSGCLASTANHGQYTSCMAKVFNALLAAGKITAAEKDALQSAVARSSVGKKK